ncbi:MAG: hypothetical protein ACKOA8_02670 [Deltaproteobacteria bacterium]
MTLTKNFFLYGCATVVAFSCIAYELLLGSYATFLMGASIFQYSLVISLMMLSMGLGALFSQRIRLNHYLTFLWVEMALAWVALLAVPLMYISFSLNWATTPVVILFVVLLGGGIGMEIPLLSQMADSKESLPAILFSDYLGGFFGGLAFPLLLFPHLGFFSIGALLAVFNSWVSVSFLLVFAKKLTVGKRWITFLTLLTLIVCLVELKFAEDMRLALESYYFGLNRN